MRKSIDLEEREIELLDLYCAGALDGEELLEAEKLISTSAYAREYVDEGFASLAQLEDNADVPLGLLSKIKAELAEGSPEKKDNVTSITRSKSTFFKPFITGALAASLIAIALVSFTWPSDGEKKQSAFSLDNSIDSFGSAPGTKNVSLKSENGQDGAVVMVNQKGDIMIDARKLKPLDENSTYQLWAVVESASGKQVISAGVLGDEPGVCMSKVNGTIKAFVITKEVSGGVEKSQHDPLYSATVA